MLDEHLHGEYQWFCSTVASLVVVSKLKAKISVVVDHIINFKCSIFIALTQFVVARGNKLLK